MKHEPIQRAARGPSPRRSERPAPEALGRESLAGDFRLIFNAFVDAFHGMASSSRLESRWSQLRYGGCC
ncbi:hypothetical protein LZ496_00110 [Sphingomonas sp. NSE70-1]|uniref:Uncharacterized protein n=1 Tax=Sphingomonas caseinilyticus TaxID=2908205 RepID=A0ABT0RQ93_9SPHN|nr:hypothetical protein [Sphingomonas caseinilyticus]MCL6697194.1 hypothetical protein [Sphingomonas caseinilyticus]